MGGDGAVSLPALRAAARVHPDLVCLHIDSHADCCPPGPSDSPFDSSNQFTHAANEKLIDPERSWHIGIRGGSTMVGMIGRTRKFGYQVVTMDDVMRRGVADVMAEYREAVAGRPVYLCWDMDVLDPSVAPGVVSPNWGGFTAREGLDLMRAMSGLNIVGADINTVSPPHDVGGMTAHLAAHLVAEVAVLMCQRLGLDQPEVV